MSGSSKHILLVENNPQRIDLIVHQVLEPMGYQVELAADASAGIEKAVQKPPDLVIINLELPGLSGKDLLVALNSQGLEIPSIVMAERRMKSDILQAVRLGATDYISLPVRETELVSVLERVLKQRHDYQKRTQLVEELEKTNEEFKQRLHDLTALLAFGRMVISHTDEASLGEKIIEAAVFLTRSDRGWLLLNGSKQNFSLNAYYNLPKSMLPKDRQTWEDGLSTLVALSGESLSIHGEALSKFKVSQLGRAALVTPIKFEGNTAGVIVVMRKSDRAFSAESVRILETVADFVCFGLKNMGLISGVIDAHSQDQTESDFVFPDIEYASVQDFPKLTPEMRKELVLANAYIGMLVDEQLGTLKAEQLDALHIIREKLQGVVGLLETGLDPQELD